MENIMFLFITVFLIISCNFGNSTSNNNKVKTQPIVLQEITVPNYISDTLHKAPETAYGSNVIHEKVKREAVTNTDCDYYDIFSVAGRLIQGQHIVILDYFINHGLRDVYVEFKTIDGTITGNVRESNITYLDGNLHNLWCTNILLTREYYYTETPEYIFANSGYKGGNKAIYLRLWRAYEEERILITPGYIIIGNREDAETYRIKSIVKNENTYTIILFCFFKEKYEIILYDDGDGITITNCIRLTNTFFRGFFPTSVNFRYIRVDEEKSKISKAAVSNWINEQLILMGKDP